MFVIKSVSPHNGPLSSQKYPESTAAFERSVVMMWKKYMRCEHDVCLQGRLRERKEVRMFKLGAEDDEFCVLFTSDYCDHVRTSITVTPASRHIIGEQHMGCSVDLG